MPKTTEQTDQTDSKGQVAIFSPPRLPYDHRVEDKFGVDVGQWKVLTEAIYPAAKSIDSIMMVLNYCKARNLDPLKRPVHIVPMWDSQRGAMVETVWPGISELRTTASRTKGYAGCDEAEFGPEKTETFKGRMKKGGGWEDVEAKVTFPEWCRITVYRVVDGARCKFVGPKVRWEETYATIGNSGVPNKMWQERPEGQIEKCAEAAALRRAFPEELGSEYTAEEMIGKPVHDLQVIEQTGDATPNRDTAPPRQAPPADPEQARDGTPPRKADPISTGGPPRKPDAAPPRTAAKDDGPKAAPGQPIKIPGTGETFESWCDKYCDNIKSSPDVATAYKWIDVNREPLEKLAKGKPSVYAKAKAAAQTTIDDLKAADEKKAAKTAAKPKAAEMDDAPVDMEDAGDFDQMTGTGSGPEAIDYGKPADDNPETILKWIEKTLAAVEAPEDLETIWENVCQRYTLDMIPPDQDEAAGILRKHEKRLEP